MPLYDVTDMTLFPLRGGIYVPSLWVWAPACHDPSQRNMVKETLCDFGGWVMKGM